jgi:hypothetical protein
MGARMVYSIHLPSARKEAEEDELDAIPVRLIVISFISVVVCCKPEGAGSRPYES